MQNRNQRSNVKIKKSNSESKMSRRNAVFQFGMQNFKAECSSPILNAKAQCSQFQFAIQNFKAQCSSPIRNAKCQGAMQFNFSNSECKGAMQFSSSEYKCQGGNVDSDSGLTY